uniref:Uncharacterized protein n=1 Tax=Strigamia maritima TaxID=126957 RepID=T1J8S0_STRMM
MVLVAGTRNSCNASGIKSEMLVSLLHMMKTLSGNVVKFDSANFLGEKTSKPSLLVASPGYSIAALCFSAAVMLMGLLVIYIFFFCFAFSSVAFVSVFDHFFDNVMLHSILQWNVRM